MCSSLTATCSTRDSSSRAGSAGRCARRSWDQSEGRARAAHTALGTGAGERGLAACLCIQAADFDELNGFDPVYRDHYFDIDLCLRLGERQRITVATPECTVILPRLEDADAPLLSNALRQQQIDQGRLRSRHAALFRRATRSPAYLAPHTTRYTIVSTADAPGQAVGDEALSVWRRRFQPGRRPLLLMAQFDAEGGCARI